MKYDMYRPGLRSFRSRSPLFRLSAQQETSAASQIVSGVLAELKRGVLREGGAFPSPERLSRLTGESLLDCVEAQNQLLDLGVLRQSARGELFVRGHTLPLGG